MKAARATALLTYRTVESFVARHTDPQDRMDDFSASSYIRYQGEKFVKRFNALCYYYLTKCLDTHDIGRGREGQENALRKISTNTLVIGIDTDRLIPTSQQQVLAACIPNARYEEIHSDFGHDGFLIETEKITIKIVEFYGAVQTNPAVFQKII